MKSSTKILVAVCLLALAACHTTKKTTSAKATTSTKKEVAAMNAKLIKRDWTLVQLSGFSKSDIAQLSAIPNLNITETISGFAGCNRLMGGAYTLKGNTITISNIASTKKMCVGVGQKIETALFSILNNVKSYKMEGVSLILYTNDNRHAEFIALDKE